jgi:hypothetical protein
MTKCNGHAANNRVKAGFEEVWKCGNEEKISRELGGLFVKDRINTSRNIGMIISMCFSTILSV